MLDRLMAHDTPGLLQVLDDLLVRIKDQLAFIIRNLRRELPVSIHGDNQRDIKLVRRVHIVFTKSRGLVDDTRTIFRRDVIRGKDLERIRIIFEVIENRLIGQADEVAPRVSREDFIVLTQFFLVGADEVFG